MTDTWVVAKVGGSLYDWPDLGDRLRSWSTHLNDSHARASGSRARILLVPGGGATAEAVRCLDRTHRLGEEASHGLALRAMSVNAQVLKALLPAVSVITEVLDVHATAATCCVLDAYPFFLADDRRTDHLPHSWEVTSDSLAMRVAVLAEASELVLLKSCDWVGDDWSAAVRKKVVDGYFVEALRQAPATLRVRIVNLRAWTPNAAPE